MAYCPAYAAPICSLCCSLDARCHDLCKPHARAQAQVAAALQALLPGGLGLRGQRSVAALPRRLHAAHRRHRPRAAAHRRAGAVLWRLRGRGRRAERCGAPSRSCPSWPAILAWFFVLAAESRRVAQEETARQTTLLMQEIEAHKRTDAALQKAKEVAEAANLAKSRYVVGPQPRAPHAAQRRAGLRAIARARRRVRRGAAERGARHPPLGRAPVRADRRAARRLQDRGRPAADPARRDPHGRFLRQPCRHVPAAGRRQGARLPVRGRGEPARGRAHRREAAAADPDQPPVERDQVHPRRARRAQRQLPEPDRHRHGRGHRPGHRAKPTSPASSSRSTAAP